MMVVESHVVTIETSINSIPRIVYSILIKSAMIRSGRHGL
jgi:hypothetical protein